MNGASAAIPDSTDSRKHMPLLQSLGSSTWGGRDYKHGVPMELSPNRQWLPFEFARSD
jgi:hypothetical protein